MVIPPAEKPKFLNAENSFPLPRFAAASFSQIGRKK